MNGAPEGSPHMAATPSRRQHERQSKKIWYRVLLLDEELMPQAEIATGGVDVSAGGIGVIFADPIDIGTPIAIQSFSLDAAGPCCLCEVRSCDELYGGWHRVGMVYKATPNELASRVANFRDPASPDRSAA